MGLESKSPAIYLRYPERILNVLWDLYSDSPAPFGL